jgi:phage-related protein
MQTIWLAWNYIYNNILVPMWNGIKTLATTIFDGLSLFWSVWGENIKIYFSVTWDTIKSVFSATLDIIGGLLKVFAGIFAGDWAMIWNGAKDIFVGIWNAITASLKGFINIMINGLNGLIAGMNRISFSVPAWVPMLGGKSFSFNIPQIPMLANGGIIDSPTLAMIGESGGEAVVPLENSSFIDGFASKVASAMVGAMRFSGSGQGSSGGDVILQIDGTQLARVLSPYQDRESQRKGNKLIIQGV